MRKDKFNKTAFGIETDPLANATADVLAVFAFNAPTIRCSFSVDSMIATALSGLGFPVWNAVKENEHQRQADEEPVYYVFNYSSFGVGYADDEPTGELSIIQVHLHAPLAMNLTPLKRKTKAALHAAGFTWPELADASDENGRHIVFEFQYVDGVDFNGDLYM